MAIPAPSRVQVLVLWIAILASFVAFLDGSIINVALPAIASVTRGVGGGLTTQQWVVDSYLITLGALILLAGSLSDLLGRIVILRVGLIGFGVASLLCAVAPDATVLILARGLQGIAGALLVPSSLALITSNFDGAARAGAIGRWTAGTTLAFLAGPILGGVIVDSVGWRWVFVINVLPIAVTMILLAALHQKDVRMPGMSIDYLGAVLCVLGLGGPVYALIEKEHYDWGNPLIWVSLAGGLLCFAGFLVRERFAKQPLMPLSLFAVRNFRIGNVSTALVYGALGVGTFIVSVYLQQVVGWAATAAAAALLPVGLLNIGLSSWAGSLAGRFGARLFMGLGPIVAAVGFLLMLTTVKSVDYWTQMLPGVIIFGIGLSATVAPLTSTILGSLSATQAGIGSAINNAVSRVAGLIAVACLGFIVGATSGSASNPQLTLDGFHRALIVLAVLLIAGGIVSLIGIKNVRTPAESPEVSVAEQS